MRKALIVASIAMACVIPVCAELTLIPQPVSVIKGQSVGYTLTADTRIMCDKDFLPAIELAVRQMNTATGFAWEVKTSGEADIVFEKDDTLAEEGYTLVSCEKGVLIKAATSKGAFYGYQTLRQLLPTAVYNDYEQKGVVWSVPAVKIADEPRFKWRGVLIDEGRWFTGRVALLKMIDTMAIHKMNVLHWHLTEDQGWRIEIKKYPQLVLSGAKRAESPSKKNPKVGDGKPYGPFYYTQEQIKEVIAYAAARQVTIVPEIEMPAHASAALSAFPEYACFGKDIVTRTRWGGQADIFCAGNDQTLRFLEDVLDEVVALFPSTYIHVGGDEAIKTRWKACPKCQKRMRIHGLKTENELQTWFIQHFAKYLKDKHNRNLVGWDEILEGGLPEGAAVMSWRGVKGGIEAAKAGHEVIMAPTTHCYYDYRQGLSNDPYKYFGKGDVTVKSAYAFNPVRGIPEEHHRYVIGVEACLWTQYIWDQPDLEWKTWPRTSALAEVGWSPTVKKDWDDFVKRLDAHVDRLDALGVNYAPLPEDAIAGWTSGEIVRTWTEKTWDVTKTIKGAGTYEVIFTYVWDGSRFDMKNVSLEADGAFVKVTDNHKGTTGNSYLSTVFTLTIPDNQGKKVLLRAMVRCDGDSSSKGMITIRRK